MPNPALVPLPRELDGQIALVTGAAQGLGLAIADELARRGARVVIADLQEAKANHAAAELERQGLMAEAVGLDIADSAAVERVFAEVVARHARLDILVNNAAIGQDVLRTSEVSDAQWARVIGVTLTGTFHCCRAAAEIMERQRGGCIVNMSSINGLTPAALVTSYNVAKAGVNALTRSLALELAAYGVRVNAVCPGPVLTEFNERVMAQRGQTLGLTQEQMIERVRASIPLGRWGEPREIAGLVAFLCGPQASWMTGELVRVSGGLEGVSAVPPRREGK
ncbi:MAG: SDR family NAD(P)-dependent oxidoreductase [Planctomycetota bacterium]|nr:SDR family NAD(P)-dependent oxidoreductase [Planctomycetota bacterium]